MNTWHIITPEYPPSSGGISHYTEQVASGLRLAGDEVHVWCPGSPAADEGPAIHRLPGGMGPSGLRFLSRELDLFPAPRRLFVQWVPHGYGFQSMNLPFCFWLWRRARKGDVVEIMLHEPFLPFGEGNWRQDAAALIHRLMTVILLRAASHVWMSTPSWERLWRPYALGRAVPFSWLPVPSNIPVTAKPEEVAQLKLQCAPGGEVLLGHFGTYNSLITSLLSGTIPLLLKDRTDRKVILMGRQSDEFRTEFIARHPALGDRVVATGALSAAGPFPPFDGVRPHAAALSRRHYRQKDQSHGKSLPWAGHAFDVHRDQ